MAWSLPVFILPLGGLWHEFRSPLDPGPVYVKWGRTSTHLETMDDIDRLVGIIADRVKARLNGVQRSLRVLSRDELRATPCTDDPSHECGECGMCATRRPESVRAITSEGACRVGAGVDTGKLDLDLARMIDHTLLKADATAADVQKLCDEARKYCFASVCVNSSQVSRASSYLENSGVM